MSSIPMPRQALGERSTNNMRSKLPTMSRLPTVTRKRKSGRLLAAPSKKIRLETTTTQRPPPAQAAKSVRRPTRPAAPATRPVIQRSAAASTAPPAASRRKPLTATRPTTARPTGTRQPAASAIKQKNQAQTKKPASGTKSKKPGWDLRGQIADLKEELKGAEDALSSHQEQSGAHLARISDLEADVAVTKASLGEKTRQCRHLIGRTTALEAELASSQVRTEMLEAKVAAQVSTISQQGSTIAHQTSAIGSLTAEKEQLSAEVSIQKASMESQRALIQKQERENAELSEKIQNMLTEMADRERRLIEAEERRKVLHNQVQELKGNIRVFCRVRPFLESESAEDAAEFICIDDEAKQLELTNLKDRSLNKTSKKLEFGFDHVFGPGSTQREIFEEISQLVQSALDGYNVCIFAYGQTGSGKTFTMEGPQNADDHSVGMIPRSVTQVFVASQALQDKGWQFEMEACFLEIYNNTIHDLLSNGDTKKPEIRMVGNGSREVEVTNIVKYPVTSEGQVADLLARAAKNRAVASTAYNERSSRSHSIFRLRITGRNTITGTSTQGTLNLVDLAGSERLPEAGYEKERLKEMKKINQSLSNLGQVIKALAAKESHIPFRNCKLTHMLQDSLGGNSKTLMFVNVSPKEDCFQETLCSLRFAVMVNNCNIGTAQKRVK